MRRELQLRRLEAQKFSTTRNETFPTGRPNTPFIIQCSFAKERDREAHKTEQVQNSTLTSDRIHLLNNKIPKIDKPLSKVIPHKTEISVWEIPLTLVL